MTTNFSTILQSRGFTKGVSGRWFSPDALRGEGVAVELRGRDAVAMFRGGRTLYEADNVSDLKKFKEEVV